MTIYLTTCIAFNVKNSDAKLKDFAAVRFVKVMKFKNKLRKNVRSFGELNSIVEKAKLNFFERNGKFEVFGISEWNKGKLNRNKFNDKRLLNKE